MNTQIDSSLSNQGFEFINYLSFENYILPLTRDLDNQKNGFTEIKNFNFSSSDYIENWNRSVWILPIKVQMQRIPVQIHLEQK